MTSIDLSRHRFLEVRRPANTELVDQLHKRLGLGESQAIALAVEVDASALLIDDRKGRSVAEAAGVKLLGVLAVLVRAKRAGLVVRVAPLVGRLERELDFRVSASLRRRILRAVDE